MCENTKFDYLSEDLYLEKLYNIAINDSLTNEQQKKKLINEILKRKYYLKVSDNILNQILKYYFNKYKKLITFKRLLIDLGLICKIGTLSNPIGLLSVCKFYRSELFVTRIKSIPKAYSRVLDNKNKLQSNNLEWKAFKYN